MKTEKGIKEVIARLDSDETRVGAIEELIADFYEKEAILSARGKKYNPDDTDYTWEEEIIAETSTGTPEVEKYADLYEKYRQRFFGGGGNTLNEVEEENVSTIFEGGNPKEEKDSIDSYVEGFYSKEVEN
ncbi:MAG: hypothetical protein K2G70_07635 [Turicibacter sp.]|nr:hypothetical protein [Turicibacter sp.]